MPLTMTYADKYGNVNPDSYWEIALFSFNNTTSVGQVTFFGWKDKDAYDAGKEFIDTITVTTKTKGEFATLAGQIGPTLVPAVYAVALATPEFKDAKPV